MEEGRKEGGREEGRREEGGRKRGRKEGGRKEGRERRREERERVGIGKFGAAEQLHGYHFHAVLLIESAGQISGHCHSNNLHGLSL